MLRFINWKQVSGSHHINSSYERQITFTLERLIKALALGILLFSIPSQALSNALAGTVYGNAIPLSGATVQIMPGSIIGTPNPVDIIASYNTLADGKYQFDVPSGTYRLDVLAPESSNLSDSYGNIVILSSQSQSFDINLLIKSGAILSGTLKLATGALITDLVHFDVWANSQTSATEFTTGVPVGASDYAIRLPPDSYRLNIRLPSFQFNGVRYAGFDSRYFGDGFITPAFPVTGDTVKDIVLPPYAQISGRVLDAEGQGFAGVSVGAQAPKSGFFYSAVYVTTDSEGYYKFAAVAGPDHHFTLTPPAGSGYLVQTVSNVDLTSDQAGIAFKLSIDPDPDPDPSYDESLPVWLLYYVNKQRANCHADRC